MVPTKGKRRSRAPARAANTPVAAELWLLQGTCSTALSRWVFIVLTETMLTRFLTHHVLAASFLFAVLATAWCVQPIFPAN
jgi:hypothetical protein